jgi:hypothetical protein
VPGRSKDHQPINLTALDRLQGIRNLSVMRTHLKVRLGVRGELN